jgi:phosphoglycerate dehydrogenase-like enzyme
VSAGRPQVLLAQAALERHQDLLESAIDTRVDWIVMSDNGDMARDVRPRVAWITPDLIRSPMTGPFFGFVRRCETLEFVQSSFTGTDMEVFGDLLARGVQLCNAHVTAIPIAEFVIGSVLEYFQDHAGFAATQVAHDYQARNFREISGSTWVIIGFGHIGRAIGHRVRAFGATVVGIRRSPGPDVDADLIVHPDHIDQHLGPADVVVLALPSSSATDGMIDARRLSMMGDDSLIVNVGRANVIDVDALVAALDSGRPEAALLDVHHVEPLPDDDPLWNHPRVRISPHTSAGGLGRFGRGADLFVDNLDRWLTERALVNLVTASDR